jgi:chromosome segregation ATPase
MKRLHHFNLLGVLALALLCVAQWQRDRQLNLEVNRLERVRLEQTSKLEEQEKTIRGLDDDLTQFKEHFARSERELNEAHLKTRAAERAVRLLTVERDQLSISVTNWINAVSARDDRLKETKAQIQRLSDELNAFILEFNRLATNHNLVIKELNELRARAVPVGAP